MIEDLKEINVGDMITIDNEDVLELTNIEDFTILNVKSYTQEEGDVIIINLESHFLIAHTLNGEPKYCFLEKVANGSLSTIEDDGFRIIVKDESMPNKLYYGRNDREIAYRAKHDPVYGMNIERDDDPTDEEAGEISICEYRGKTKIKSLSVIMLERLDDQYIIYQGLQISEANILL